MSTDTEWPVAGWPRPRNRVVLKTREGEEFFGTRVVTIPIPYIAKTLDQPAEIDGREDECDFPQGPCQVCGELKTDELQYIPLKLTEISYRSDGSIFYPTGGFCCSKRCAMLAQQFCPHIEMVWKQSPDAWEWLVVVEKTATTVSTRQGTIRIIPPDDYALEKVPAPVRKAG